MASLIDSGSWNRSVKGIRMAGDAENKFGVVKARGVCLAPACTGCRGSRFSMSAFTLATTVRSLGLVRAGAIDGWVKRRSGGSSCRVLARNPLLESEIRYRRT